MGSVQILLGKTRVRRRAHLKREAITGTDRYGVPNFLYITDTVRKKTLVEVEFVRYREGAAFVPEVLTVAGLLDRLIARHGDGRAPWSPVGAGLVAEALLEREGAAWPWLLALGEPARVGADLAALFADWDEADRPVPDAPRGPELVRFFVRLHAELAASPARTPMGDALRRLESALGRPSDALGQWLAAPHAVIVDDVLHPSPLRRRVLLQLARSWGQLGAHVFFCFESGRDFGGAEAAKFFEYDDDEAVAFSLRPFQATRALRRALFASFVEEGGDADILVAGRDELRAVEPGAEPGEAEPADVADRLYTDGAGPADAGNLRLVRWPDAATEIRGIGHEIKERLLAGDSPEKLWVAIPGLPRYLPMLRRIFTELGIPFAESRGRPVAARPVARIASIAARAAAEGFPVGPMLDALASDLTAAMTRTQALTLARMCRERGVTAGHPARWRDRLAPLDGAVAVGGVVDGGVVDGGVVDGGAVDAFAAVCDALAPLAGPCDAVAWRDALLSILDAWQLVPRAEACRDAVPLTDSIRRRVIAQTLAGIGEVQAAIEDVARDALAARDGAWPPARLARLLDDRLAEAALHDVTTSERVQVVGMLELRGIHPERLWIAGLVADDFPAPLAEDYLLPRSARRALDTLEPADEARYLLGSALRNATAGGHFLTLSWPRTRDDKPVAVAPLVEDLLPIEVAEGVTLRDRIEDRHEIDGEPMGAFELERRLGERWHDTEDPWRALGAAPERLEAIAARLAARADPEGFGRWDGVLDSAPALPEVVVTAVEDYLACPARYFYGRVLRLSEEDRHDPDLDRARGGTLLHQILHLFILGLQGRGVPHLRGLDPGERIAMRRELCEIGEKAIAADPVAAGLSAPLASYHHARWLAGLVDDAPQGVLAAWLDFEMEGGAPTSFLSTEREFRDVRYGPLQVRGRVDRVDAIGSDGVLVIDYKTGRAPSAAAVRAGLKVQALIYLDAVADGDGARDAAAYLELRTPGDVGYAGWTGGRDALETLGAGRGAVALDPAERDDLRAYIAAAGARIERGVFHPTLAGPDAAGCEWCAFRRVCRVDHARAGGILERDDPRWQAPRQEPG